MCAYFLDTLINTYCPRRSTAAGLDEYLRSLAHRKPATAAIVAKPGCTTAFILAIVPPLMATLTCGEDLNAGGRKAGWVVVWESSADGVF